MNATLLMVLWKLRWVIQFMKMLTTSTHYLKVAETLLAIYELLVKLPIVVLKEIKVGILYLKHLKGKVVKMIVKSGKGYKVKSESGKNLSKGSLSKGAAKKRLAQVEYFKKKGK
jgi:hypothetical protein